MCLRKLKALAFNSNFLKYGGRIVHFLRLALVGVVLFANRSFCITTDSRLAFDRLVDIVNATGKGYAVWQEIIDHHVKVKADTLVEVWKVRVLNNFIVLS